MTQRILIMGLPGAGKTYLAQHIVDHLQAEKKRVGWLNADDVRKKYNDWDLVKQGAYVKVCVCVNWQMLR